MNMKPLRSQIHQNRGVTLTELMIVIAIIGIIAGFAVPSYQDLIERNRLKQAAESLADDMKFARTEAVKQSRTIALCLTAGWSYTVKSDADNDNDDTDPTDICTVNDADDLTLKTVQGNQFQGVALSAAGGVELSFRRGTPNATLRTLLESTKYKAAIDVCQSGKVIVCTPNNPTTKAGLPGYPTCPATVGDCQ